MQIAIDIREYSHTPAGIGNYCAGLAEGLVRAAEVEDFILYGHGVFPAGAVGRGVRHRVVGNAWRFGWRRAVWENAVLPFDLLRRGVGVFHATSHLVPPGRFGVRLVATVHDMTNFLFPEWYPARNNAYRRRMIRRAVKGAGALIAVSRSTAADIERLFPEARGRVRVVYEGVQPIFSPKASVPGPEPPRECSGRYVLFVGTLSPRKNLGRLGSAFARMAEAPRNADVRLVLAGMRGWKCEEDWLQAGAGGGRGRVYHVGFPSNEVLAEMYRRAELVCLPSLYEGFGLPIAEAMASGTPVLASNRSSLPEVVGDEASLVDPENVEEMAGRMDALLNDGALRKRVAAAGLAKAKEFTWERAARETLRIYREAG